MNKYYWENHVNVDASCKTVSDFYRYVFFTYTLCLFQVYESYSFEELRFASPTPKR